MDKSPDAFKTISEVAEELDLPQHVLRFWETRFSQIRPLKRGGGRRYYRPDDVDLLRGIRHFLYGEGYTIKGLQRILKDEGNAFVQAVGRGEIIPSAGMQAAAESSDLSLDTETELHDSPIYPGFPEETRGGGQGSLFPDAVFEQPAVSNRLPKSKVKLLKSILDDLQECERVLAGVKLPG